MTDEELIARLRERPYRLGFESEVQAKERRQKEREIAADRMEALVKERDALTRRNEHWRRESDRAIHELTTRAERLEAAASSVADDVCSYICPSVGRAGEPILHDPRCIALRAALKGGDHV